MSLPARSDERIDESSLEPAVLKRLQDLVKETNAEFRLNKKLESDIQILTSENVTIKKNYDQQLATLQLQIAELQATSKTYQETISILAGRLDDNAKTIALLTPSPVTEPSAVRTAFPALPPPSAASPTFQMMKGKKRQRHSAPDPADLPLSNKYQVLQTSNEEIEDSAGSASDDAMEVPSPSLRTVKTPPKPRRPPPIILSDKENWPELTKKFKSCCVGEVSAKYTGKTIRLQTTEVADHRSLTKYMDESSIQYHTYQLEPRASIQVVLRGVPEFVADSTILQELQDRQFDVLKVQRMRVGPLKRPIPLVLVELRKGPNTEQIYNLRTVDYCTISVESKRKSDLPTQCYRCQFFGHGARNCRRDFRCLKCGEPHATYTCKKDREDPAKCCNCAGDHPCNFKGCAAHPAQRILKKKAANLESTRPPPSRPVDPNLSYAGAASGSTMSDQHFANHLRSALQSMTSRLAEATTDVERMALFTNTLVELFLMKRSN